VSPPQRLDSLARRPHLTGMKIDELMRELERAWAHALPGHEAAERDAVLRELWRELQRQPVAHAPVRLRVVRS